MQKNCPDKKFIRIDGRNGATFFFSVNSFADWRCSLEFYRGVSLIAKLKKCLLVCSYIWMKRRAVLSGKDVSDFIANELKLSTPPEIADRNSAMISPTRDKVVIHRHHSGYEKIASGKSRDAICNEIDFYQKLLDFSPKEFVISEISEVRTTPLEAGFFMKQISEKTSEKVPLINELLPLLKDLFNFRRGESVPWQNILDELKSATCDEDLLDAIENCRLFGNIRRGPAHRDFKPWNLKKLSSGKFLLFDFESAVYNGLPLEDFFNYIVENALITASPRSVLRKINKFLPLAGMFLNQIGINPDQTVNCCKWYLLERSVYWRNQSQKDHSDKFLTLYELFIDQL